MKLFSTLFLSLALITGAAQAHNNLSECELENDIDLSVNCDCDYCDNEINDITACKCNCDCEEQEAPQVSNIPSNPQEKLEWGLKNLKIQAVVQALHAGANPDKIKPNAYCMLLEGFEQSCNTLRYPYATESAEVIINHLVATRHACEIAALLIENGVSVDNAEIPFIYGSIISPREFIKHIVVNSEYKDFPGSRYENEYRYYGLLLIQKLQTLIDKYQPEAKA